MKGLLTVGNVVLGVVNLLLFALWWSLIRVTAGMPSESDQYVLNSLSVQLTILELVLAAVAISLAILGIFGYRVVIEAAENKADEVSRAYLAKASTGDGMRSNAPSEDVRATEATPTKVVKEGAV